MTIFLYSIYCGIWKYTAGRGYSDGMFKDPKLKYKKGNIIWKKSYLALLSKAPIYAYIAIPTYWMLGVYAPLIIWCGLMIPSVIGWGKLNQAMASTGNKDIMNKEAEFTPIDWVVEKLYGKAYTKDQARQKAKLWGLLFSLTYFPMFIALGSIYNLWYLLIMGGVLLMGELAYLCNRWYFFEWLFGALLGFLIAVGI